MTPSFDRLKVCSVTDNSWPAFGWQRPKVPNLEGGYMLQLFYGQQGKWTNMFGQVLHSSRLVAALFKSEHGQWTEKFVQV